MAGNDAVEAREALVQTTAIDAHNWSMIEFV